MVKRAALVRVEEHPLDEADDSPMIVQIRTTFLVGDQETNPVQGCGVHAMAMFMVERLTEKVGKADYSCVHNTMPDGTVIEKDITDKVNKAIENNKTDQVVAEAMGGEAVPESAIGQGIRESQDEIVADALEAAHAERTRMVKDELHRAVTDETLRDALTEFKATMATVQPEILMVLANHINATMLPGGMFEKMPPGLRATANIMLRDVLTSFTTI